MRNAKMLKTALKRSSDSGKGSKEKEKKHIRKEEKQITFNPPFLAGNLLQNKTQR